MCEGLISRYFKSGDGHTVNHQAMDLKANTDLVTSIICIVPSVSLVFFLTSCSSLPVLMLKFLFLQLINFAWYEEKL